MKRLRHPIRAIEEPFGKAAMVVAVIALVLAMTGAAFAKGLFTKAQEKKIAAIAKKYAGKPGAPGAQGSAGPQGPAGAPGAKGDPGTNGTNGKSVEVSAVSCGGLGGAEVKQEGAVSGVEVCNGQTGFTATLPSEATETGSWITQIFASGTFARIGFSFPIPLSQPIPNVTGSGPTEEHHLFYVTVSQAQAFSEGKFGAGAGELCEGKSGTELSTCETEFKAKAQACPGTAEEPQAKAGDFCMYGGREHNLRHEEAFYTSSGLGPKVGTVGGWTGFEATAEPGFGMGSWAVTAP